MVNPQPPSINIELPMTALPSGNRKNESHVSHQAGPGNTFLHIDFIASSCVIGKFLEMPWLDSREVLAYFYCSRTSSDTRQQDPKAILLSILRQLASSLPGLPLKSPVITAYDKETVRGSREARLSVDEIKVLLNELIQNHYDSVTIVLDALDECDASSRMHLLDTITTLTYNPKTIVKTLVSSRSDSDIMGHFLKV